MSHEAVMFDLDGTLLDTLADIAAAANAALARLQRPILDPTRYRQLVGSGAPWLMERALGPSFHDLTERAVKLYQENYARQGSARTRTYPGIEDLLDALTGRRLRMAVLSNKPHAAVQECVRRFLNRWRLDAVQGQVDLFPLKPDPSSALAIAERLDVSPGSWVYVGDTGVDMLTARAAGMFAVGALWGFRDEAELRENGAQAIIEHPRRLLEFL